MEKLIIGLCYIVGIMLFCVMVIYSLNKELEHQEKRDNAYQDYIENNKQTGGF